LLILEYTSQCQQYSFSHELKSKEMNITGISFFIVDKLQFLNRIVTVFLTLIASEYGDREKY
jgi:hypothetical protein